MWIRMRCRRCHKKLIWANGGFAHKAIEDGLPFARNCEDGLPLVPPKGKHLFEWTPINWLATKFYTIFVAR